MKTISIREAKNRLTELAREVETGETIIVTRHGKPVFDLVPHKRKGGIDYNGAAAFRRAHNIDDPFPYIAKDFDDPLPEDFLIQPLPLER